MFVAYAGMVPLRVQRGDFVCPVLTMTVCCCGVDGDGCLRDGRCLTKRPALGYGLADALLNWHSLYVVAPGGGSGALEGLCVCDVVSSGQVAGGVLALEFLPSQSVSTPGGGYWY